MSVRIAAPTYQSERPGLFMPARYIAAALVWLTTVASAVVFFEPAPFDVLAVGLIPLLPLLRVTRFSVAITLYLGVWLVIAAAGLLASAGAITAEVAIKHTFITFYLSMASVVIAAFVASAPVAHARTVLSAYTLAAVIAATTAVIGYFTLVPGAFELFTEFGRGRGTFKDPNVFGAFLTPAILYLLHTAMTRGPLRGLIALTVLPVLAFGVLISFSRGAWANLGLSLVVFGYLSFVTAPTARRQVSMIFAGLVATGLLLGVLFLALQNPDVADFVSKRAAFSQSYDVGPGGRFPGQLKALNLILLNPLGLGGLHFGLFFHASDVHNIYLSMFLNAGWLGGALYAAVIMVTLLAGFRHVLRKTAARDLLIVAYSAFVGTAGEGIVVDTDHWRHFFVLLALTWGLMAARSPPPGARGGSSA